MTLFRPILAACLLAFAGTAPAAVPEAAFDDYRAIYRDLVARHADAVVTVKFVMSLTTSGNEQRVEDRTQAIVVSADGLLLVPERAVSVDLGQLGNATPGQAAPVATSSDFRVRLADSEDWLPADLVTRDGELGLAWLRLRDPPRRLGFVDLGQGVGPEPGMVFFSLLRTSDEWGAVPVFRPGLVLGETRNPTFRLLVDGVPGLAFSHDGRPMGYVDIDLGAVTRQRGTGLGLDFADLALRMTPIDKVAAATAQAAKLPVAGR
ncbi:MAG TPA: hypothetical protein VFQ84_06435 [Arenimonas sp.]|uniref:hypothetical protein n=1 Tax=Arenimonas sp. TaxID=1872635 RepID=UPI002D806424|nr:hypothetical protein [Arenimonas sp.]HEU0152964.1 hypothetical protein [Arenimonas sp.]